MSDDLGVFKVFRAMALDNLCSYARVGRLKSNGTNKQITICGGK